MKLISSFLFLALLALQTNAQSLQRVAPEQVGMDSRKLMYADEAIETAIANKDIHRECTSDICYTRCCYSCSTQWKNGLPQSLWQQTRVSQHRAYDREHNL